MAPPSQHLALAATNSSSLVGAAKFARAGKFVAGTALYCGASPRRGALALTVPVGGRRAVVVTAAAAAPGGGDLPSDSEGLVSKFRFEMQLFRMSQRPVALLGEPKQLLERALDTARACVPMIEFLIGKKAAVGRDSYKELVAAGRAALVVEAQGNEGYVRADAVANAVEGLKIVGTVFFNPDDLPHYTTPEVPLSGDDDYRKSYLPALINLFMVYYIALEGEASCKYGYNPPASN